MIEVSEDGGQLRLRAEGSFFPAHRKGEWRLTVDPEAGHLVRQAAFFDAGSEAPEFEASSSGLARDGASSVAAAGSAIIPGLREDQGPSLTVTVSSYRAAPDAALIAATIKTVTAPAPKGALEEGPRAVEMPTVGIFHLLAVPGSMNGTTSELAGLAPRAFLAAARFLESVSLAMGPYA